MNTTTGREHWLAARTLADLGDLAAQWLEGAITHQPCYNAHRPEPETTALIPHLAAYNRAGYYTNCSQPGHEPRPSYSDNLWTQRAFVSGFASEDTVNAVVAAILGTRLVALATPPGYDSSVNIPVTMEGDRPTTWIGVNLDPDGIVHYYREDCPQALGALLNAWQLDVFDPEWGDNTLLWSRLDQALRDVAPAGSIGASPSPAAGA